MGATCEGTVKHLSEREREATGPVFTLAGYLIHGLYEAFPFIMVDSLEALDSDRIAALVEYFDEYVEYLVVALLPEDAAALDENHQHVTGIGPLTDVLATSIRCRIGRLKPPRGMTSGTHADHGVVIYEQPFIETVPRR